MKRYVPDLKYIGSGDYIPHLREEQPGDDEDYDLVVLYSDAQGRIDELKTALENVRNQERERYADALVACVTSRDAISRELQAVYEFARGRCCACSGMTEDKYGQRVLYTERCYGCVEYSGDEDAVTLWEPAWKVEKWKMPLLGVGV